MNLAAIDLNLLLVFDALMRDCNVTRAGQRIGLSQPAMSRALYRLRDIVGDPPFVRRGNRMEPTPRALAPDRPLQRAVSLRAIRHQIASTARTMEMLHRHPAHASGA